MFLASVFAPTVGNRRNVNRYAAYDTSIAHITHARAPGSFAPPPNAKATAAGAAADAPNVVTSRSRLASSVACDAVDRDADARRLGVAATAADARRLGAMTTRRCDAMDYLRRRPRRPLSLAIARLSRSQTRLVANHALSQSSALLVLRFVHRAHAECGSSDDDEENEIRA
jgi:hypothetical protein